MNQYTGSKSLDAEIEIDFKDKTILFDYTKNKLSPNGESSHSAVLPFNDWERANFKTQIPYVLKSSFVKMFGFFISCGLLICRLLTPYIVKSASMHLYYQSMLRWICTAKDGTYLQSVNGSISGTIVTFTLENNVWFTYKLTEDYETKIKKISFVRNFVKFKRYGEFNEMRQNGWNIIFEFTEPPQKGECSIEHTA